MTRLARESNGCYDFDDKSYFGQTAKEVVNSPTDLKETLTEKFDDLKQVTMRLVRPDLTDNEEWYLKHDLRTHPRFANSRK